MAVPQNITDDLTALDAAETTKESGAATLAAAQATLTADQAAVATATTADQANGQAVTDAEQKLFADVQAWIGTNPTPAPASTEKGLHPKLKAALRKCGK